MFARIGPTPRAPASLSNSSIYGPVLRQAVPAGIAIGAAEAAVTTGAMVAAFGSFTREQEREADRQGIEIASQAGFNPHGGVRIIGRILQEKGDKWSSYASTHPTEGDRVDSMRKDIAADPRGNSASETEITTMDISLPRPRSLRAIAVGEYRPTLHDSEQRVPTLYERIRCKLQDDSEVQITRIECVRRQGTPIR
jgi:predicted Zn-dependent protease